MNKQYSLLVYPLAMAAILSVSGCGLSPDSSDTAAKRERSFANIDASVLIELPSSIAASENQGLARNTMSKDATPNNAGEIYDGIRAWVGMANDLVNNDEFGARALILFWRDALDWKNIQEVGQVSGSEGEYRWTGSYAADRTFAYHLTVTKISVHGEPVALKIEFNGDFELPAGQVYYNVDLLDSSVSSQVQVLVEFEKTMSLRTLDVSITSAAVISPASDDFKNGKISLREQNGIVHISGSSYHPNIDSILSGVKGHCYTFTGVVDIAANQAIINLGLPPADYQYNDQTLFTTYGIAEIFTQALIHQEIPKLQDTIKMVMVTSYKDSMTIEEILSKIVLSGSADFLHNASEITSMSANDFIYFLELNQSISDAKARADFNSFLWITSLKQPVYFNRIGYVGNGSTIPAGFSHLASIECMVPALAPLSIRDLEI